MLAFVELFNYYTHIDNATGETKMQIAQTILAQLGGNKFVAMTGAKQLVAGPNFLQFSIGRGARNGINKVKVSLVGDLYTVEFFAGRSISLCTVATVEQVYADRLAAVFTAQTGFDTRL